MTSGFLNPRSIGEAADELLTLLREQGVQRVVTMSALNVDFDLDRQPSRLRGEYNKEVEAATVASGLEWAPLHERDLAAVGARALLTDELVGRRPVLTGPRSLTQEEMVGIIGEAIGKPLSFEEVPPEAAKQGMVKSGLPEVLADGFLGMQAESYGQRDLVSGEVEAILGRPALTFADWAADHADDFRN